MQCKHSHTESEIEQATVSHIGCGILKQALNQIEFPSVSTCGVCDVSWGKLSGGRLLLRNDQNNETEERTFR